MNNNCSPIRIIIADDHPVTLSGFKRMLEGPEFEVIGEASNGEELLQLSKDLKPDIIVTDIKMPLMDGLEATKQIIKELPNVGIIALSMFDEYSLIMDMTDAGAKGYLLKNVARDEIIAAVYSVYNGEIYYCKETTARMVKMLSREDYNALQEDALSKFSEIEIDIIKLLRHGSSNKEIARDLSIRSRRVEWHRVQIMKKLNAKNLAGIVLFAVKNNIF